MNETGKPRIVVLGAGFGGLEAAFLLRMRLADRADITVIADDDSFTFRPNTIYIPFGLNPAKLRIALARPFKRRKIDFVKSAVYDLDLAGKVVKADGNAVPYDYLIIATGAGMRPDEIPGLRENAETPWTIDDMLRLRTRFAELVASARDGARRKILFLIPPNNRCAGPLYEMVMMMDTWLRRRRLRKQIDLVWTTFEKYYIQVFGPRLNEVVTGEFARREITGYREWYAEKVDKNGVHFRGDRVLPFDLLISFPPYIAKVIFDGLPADDRGFITTESATRQVQGHPDVYAVGDAADFPVKQAYLALLQADAAAEHIASRILGTKCELTFEPVSMCVMEQFDKATFAQVPLRLTGLKDRPVEVPAEFAGTYRVGSSLLWRAGKMALGFYLPARFKAGNPFHAGLGWDMMNLMLKVMSKLFAR